MFWTIIYILGFVLLILGILNVIRFDGSVKRVVICSAMILMGLALSLVGGEKKDKVPIEYEVEQVQVVSTDGNKYRITLKSGVNSTVIYTDRAKVGTIKEGDKITLTKEEIKEMQ